MNERDREAEILRLEAQRDHEDRVRERALNAAAAAGMDPLEVEPQLNTVDPRIESVTAGFVDEDNEPDPGVWERVDDDPEAA